MEVLSKRVEAETLPPEILALIFQYLSEKDISRCSRVCVKWREETNRNKIWKRICILKGWIELLHLDKLGAWRNITPRHVTPYLEIPDPTECTRFSPLSEWHEQFLQIEYMNTNWRNANYVIQKFDEQLSESLGDITAMDYHSQLVLLGSDNGIVSLWDYTSDGLKFLEQINCVFKDAEISHIISFDKRYFAVLQLGLLQIYLKRDGIGYYLCYVKAMIAQDVNLPDLLRHWPIQEDVDSWFIENVYELFEDEKFQFSASCHERPLIAFWGTIRGVEVLSLQSTVSPQLKLLNLPYENYVVTNIFLCGCNSLMYILLNFKTMPSVIIEYSLESDSCVKHFRDSSYVMNFFVDHRFVLSMDITGLFSVWNCDKGEKLHVFKSPDSLPPTSDFELFGDILFYHSKDKIGCILNWASQTRLHEQMTIESTASYLAMGMNDFFLLRQDCDVEVWSRTEKKKLYEIKDILIKDHPYSVQCQDSCIVLLGLNMTPTFIWFW